MKKKIVFGLVFIVLLSTWLCACNKRTSISEEYSQKSYIVIENTVMDRLISIGITRYIGDVAVGSTGMANADNSIIKDKFLEFECQREDFPVDSDLQEFAIQISVTEDNGITYDLEKLNIPLTFGKDIFLELTYEDGHYGIRRTE